MDFTRRYDIPFKGLAEGKHEFNFDIDDRFFQEFETSGIKGGEGIVRMEMTKSRTMLEMAFEIQVQIVAECDRCLADCVLPVEYRGKLIVRFGENAGENDGDIVWLSPSENEFNAAQYIYESIILSLPYQRVHPEDEDGNPTCDPDMLARFRIVTPEEFGSIEQAHEEQKLEENPEWEKLRELRDKL